MRKTFENVVATGLPTVALDPTHVQLQISSDDKQRAPLNPWTGPPHAPHIIEHMAERAIVRPPLPPLGGER